MIRASKKKERLYTLTSQLRESGGEGKMCDRGQIGTHETEGQEEREKQRGDTE